MSKKNNGKDCKYNQKTEHYRKQAKELVAQMTLQEKVFQTLHSAPAIERLGIKSYNWWNEALHGVARAGVATVFPQAIGLAATFDEELMQTLGEVISTEGRAKFNMQQKYSDTDIYKGLTFWSPNVNIFRDPRWGRGHETYGEDPYLTSALGVSFIKTMQGDGEYMRVAACAKHFAVHSGPEDIRHSFDAVVSKQDMFETYLPAFKACVKEAGVEAVMGAYNRVNGEPCCGSQTLLQDILRREWEFDGHVVSDCWAIKDFHEYHHVTGSPVESVSLAMNNGCDLNCGNIFIYLEQAVKEGLVKEERLNEAIIRLLITRMKLGLFEENGKVAFDSIDYKNVDCADHKTLNKEISKKTIVLLKNENHILPLKKESLKSIGVIGPNANNRRALVGNYEGTASEYVTILEGIQEFVGDEIRVFYSEGCHLHKNQISSLGETNDRLSEVKAVCDQSDVIIACMGLDSGLEGEEGDQGNAYASGDKAHILLPGLQEDILKAIYESGKPAILVLLSGSALAVNWADEHMPAIVQGWYPGAQGGRAIAELLFGTCSPQGKLPITFYRSTEELPDFTDYSMKERTYRYITKEPLYPFGYGLSYTDIHTTEVRLSSEYIGKEDITIEATLENKGEMAGTETLQVYVKCMKEETPNPTLKGIKKVELQPGESKTIRLRLTPWDFGLYDEEAYLKLYKGNYKVYVGTSQPDERSFELTGKKVDHKTVQCLEDTVLYHPSIFEQ